MSIQVKQLMSLLEQVPDNYEVILELTERVMGIEAEKGS